MMLLNRCSVTNEMNALLSDQSELWISVAKAQIWFPFKIDMYV